MPPKKNPLGLNPLQLKTLTLVQALARLEDYADPADPVSGAITLNRLPKPHGDHFHLGDAVVRSSDATGLFNAAVWVALRRKGLVDQSQGDGPILLTAAGQAYDTGLADQLLHRADH